jgi:hypothetical protein
MINIWQSLILLCYYYGHTSCMLVCCSVYEYKLHLHKLWIYTKKELDYYFYKRVVEVLDMDQF